MHIHHIDGNPANSNPNNLAVLCLNCHGRVSGKPGFGRNFTVAEVRAHKREWEARCLAVAPPEDADANDEPGSGTPETDHSEVRLEADEDYLQEFELNEGETLIIDLAADGFLDAYLCHKRHFRQYERGYDLKSLVAREGIRAGRLQFEAPSEGIYCLFLTVA